MSDDKKSKPTYQAPVVVPFGELAAGEGQTCQSGGTASSCRIGGHAANNCANGTSAGNRCGIGTSPGCFFVVF